MVSRNTEELKKKIRDCLFWVGEDVGYPKDTPICVSDTDKLRELLASKRKKEGNC